MRGLGFSFQIHTPEELIATLKEDFAALQANPRSSRFAVHCAFIGWHLHEWIWAKKFKGDWAARQRSFSVVPREKDEFVAAIRKECPDLKIMQGVTEGTKHLGTSAVDGTVSDLHNSMFGNHKFNEALFNDPGVLGVELSSGEVVRFLPAVERVIAYWEKLLAI